VKYNKLNLKMNKNITSSESENCFVRPDALSVEIASINSIRLVESKKKNLKEEKNISSQITQYFG